MSLTSRWDRHQKNVFRPPSPSVGPALSKTGVILTQRRSFASQTLNRAAFCRVFGSVCEAKLRLCVKITPVLLNAGQKAALLSVIRKI